jgi:hypothetical protein
MKDNSGRKYDLYSQEFKANAYETFAKMWQDNPVFQQPGMDGETLIIDRFPGR